MNFRLKTSKETGDRLVSLQATTGLTWNILSRIALALSLRDPSMPNLVENKSGVDINRNAMTGENDYIYKALIRQHAQRNVTDEEYFPDLFNAHLERGIVLLDNEYKHARNYEKLLQNLLKMEG
ncbi:MULTISPECIES: DNA sulfur modification protein DndE [Priestia]|jgi:DNA sulfur modification protein DndE|uniref:DNA sulfur modification protein DndE n=1 Tax=Priestia aryabhattai TaxID=412384 RepID=A0AAX6N6L8_PRIAR|nr:MULTISPECIES: DNA sulfur modification protein DndE [Priestia]MDE8673617.1 DNA sulfur modification protein DndE [Priestia aryabhattai]MDU9691124.1 DNA sulfur modification protein DndE [Priestia aryabhattai]MED3896428.1 DNA sulfur modification protein DndE [Priestia aryabhattai]QSF36781.1 DNA sulfur modification protein DndE [Priestia megaterium]WJN42593.1 DNA sulfur modification protein DndE [Priestia aryabhattai]